MQVSFTSLFILAVACCGIGFTLLNYSKDGDLKLRNKILRYYSRESTREEAWARLSALANAQATEVTWNTSLFVALVSALAFLGLLQYAKRLENSPTTTSVLFFLCLSIVFGLQDGVIRWKAAHRKNASAQEQIQIIERLKWKDI
jgi:hypothetical protein